MYTIQSRLQRVAWGRIQRTKSNIMAMMLFDGGRGKRREMAAAGYGIVLNAWENESVSKTRRRGELSVGTYGALQDWAAREVLYLAEVSVRDIRTVQPSPCRRFSQSVGWLILPCHLTLDDEKPLFSSSVRCCVSIAHSVHSWPSTMGPKACLPFGVALLVLDI